MDALETALAPEAGLLDAAEGRRGVRGDPDVEPHHAGVDRLDHPLPDKLNPRGGAISLGHALGSSGTRLLTTLVNQLEATQARWGLQTMCEGGGMANATIIERL